MPGQRRENKLISGGYRAGSEHYSRCFAHRSNARQLVKNGQSPHLWSQNDASQESRGDNKMFLLHSSHLVLLVTADNVNGFTVDLYMRST